MVKISIHGKPHISFQGPVLKRIRRHAFIFYPSISEDKRFNVVLNGVKDDYKFKVYEGQVYNQHVKDKESKYGAYLFPKQEYNIEIEESYFEKAVGGGINVNRLIFKNGKLNEEGLYVLFSIIKDLCVITGASISVNSEGNLVSVNGAKDVNGNLRGSTKARNYLQSILKSSKTIYISNDDSKNTQGGGIGHVNINADQIDGNIQAVKNGGIQELTFGFGMSFLHETLHTATGTLAIKPSATTAIVDPPNTNPNATGPTVDKINEFRIELGLPVRLHYFWQQTSVSSSEKMKWKIGKKTKSITKIQMSLTDQSSRRESIKKLINLINVFGYEL